MNGNLAHQSNLTSSQWLGVESAVSEIFPALSIVQRNSAGM